MLVVLLSGVDVGGFFGATLLPPFILLIGWAIYAAIDDRVEAHAGALYDRAAGGRGAAVGEADAAPLRTPRARVRDGRSPARAEGRPHRRAAQDARRAGLSRPPLARRA